MKKKILVVQVAALSRDIINKYNAKMINGLEFQAIKSVFPAVTCTVQASFRTASLPEKHGMVANGLFHKSLKKVLFWEQSAAQVNSDRIWDNFRKSGGSVGMMFWQQSLGEDIDFIISPAPIHKHHGGMIQDCYSKPADVYPFLCNKLKRPFNLMNYWGPLASPKSSQWIADATCAVMAEESKAPDLLFTYLPALDYDLQRFGAEDNKRINKSWNAVAQQMEQLITAADANGYEILIFGDYAIADCKNGVVYPNKVLRDAGLLGVRIIKEMQYVDLYDSRAFAVVDHEIAHIHISNKKDTPIVTELLQKTDGIKDVLNKDAQKEMGIDHPLSGDLVIVAEEGRWLSYRWWDKSERAPEYASHVDIHNKPGFDPCELFFGWPPGSVSSDDLRVGGTHGKIDSNREVVWASSCLSGNFSDLIELAKELERWLIK